MSSLSVRKSVRALCILLLAGAARVQGQEAEAFRSDELNEARVAALAAEHNPGLKSSLLQLESARQDVRGLESQYAPVLVLDTSVTQTENPSLVSETGININRIRRADTGAEVRKHLIWGTDLTLRVATYVQSSAFSRDLGLAQGGSMGPAFEGKFGPAYGLAARLSLKQPLLRGSGRAIGEANLLASRVKRSGQEQTRDRVASQLLRDALTAYWELWYANASLRIEEQSRDLALRQHAEAEARAQVGALAPADVLSFETQVATREEAVLNAGLVVEQRELDLLQQLGLVERRPNLSVDTNAVPLMATTSRDWALSHALSQSSELKELEAQVELSRLQSKTAADPQRSRLDLDSYVQTQGLGNKEPGDTIAQLRKSEVFSGFVGLTYEAPLTSRVQQAQAAKARLAAEVAEQNLAQARQRVLAEVELMLKREQTGEQRVALAERTVSIAERQLAAEQARFESGTSIPLNLVEAENTVRNARIRVARARADLVTSVLSLQHLTGQLLERYAALHPR